MATRRHGTAFRAAFLLAFALLFPLSLACPVTRPPLPRPRVPLYHRFRPYRKACRGFAMPRWNRLDWLTSAGLDRQRRRA